MTWLNKRSSTKKKRQRTDRRRFYLFKSAEMRPINGWLREEPEQQSSLHAASSCVPTCERGERLLPFRARASATAFHSSHAFSFHGRCLRAASSSSRREAPDQRYYRGQVPARRIPFLWFYVQQPSDKKVKRTQKNTSTKPESLIISWPNNRSRRASPDAVAQSFKKDPYKASLLLLHRLLQRKCLSFAAIIEACRNRTISVSQRKGHDAY